jgi:hypothetical protein
VPLRVAFPERLADEEEPFVSWGPLERFDVVWVRAVSPGVFSFGLDTAAERARPERPRSWTPGIQVEPERFYDVVVDVDRVARRVGLEIEGVRRIELEGSLAPAVPRYVWPGRGPRGSGAPRIGHFSGTMIPEDMWLAGPPGLESLPAIADGPALLTATRTPTPHASTPGTLWAVAGRRGAFLLTKGGWRWIPTASVERVVLEYRVADEPPGLSPAVVPVLVSGDAEGAEAVVLRRVDRRRVTVGFARRDGSWTVEAEGPALLATEVAKGVLRVQLDRPGHTVAVDLDGHAVLRTTTELRPLRPEDLHIGRTAPFLER